MWAHLFLVQLLFSLKKRQNKFNFTRLLNKYSCMMHTEDNGIPKLTLLPPLRANDSDFFHDLKSSAFSNVSSSSLKFWCTLAPSGLNSTITDFEPRSISRSCMPTSCRVNTFSILLFGSSESESESGFMGLINRRDFDLKATQYDCE